MSQIHSGTVANTSDLNSINHWKRCPSQAAIHWWVHQAPRNALLVLLEVWVCFLQSLRIGYLNLGVSLWLWIGIKRLPAMLLTAI